MLNTHKSETDRKPKWSQKKEFTSGYLLTKNNAIPPQPLEPKDKYSFTWILNRWANPQVGISSWGGGHILKGGGHILISGQILETQVGKSSHEYNPNPNPNPNPFLNLVFSYISLYLFLMFAYPHYSPKHDVDWCFMLVTRSQGDFHHIWGC